MKNLFVILLLIASAIAQAATTEGGSQGVTIRPAGTSAGATGELRLKELTGNGANHVGLKAPDAISADKVWTLPAADGTNGQVLTTNGSGVLSFTTATGSVTDVTASSPLASSGGATPNISISSIIGSSFGGTGNGFTKFSGPATSEKTFTLPNSNGVILAPSSIGTNAQIPISDGTSVTMRSIGTDATISNTGALTIANNAITTAKITDANVTTAKIADLNVTTAKIADSNVTTAKIANDSVTYAKLNSELKTGALFRRNLIINGDMEIDQRKSGGTYSTAGSVSIDRWGFYSQFTSSAAANIARSTNVPSSAPFSYSFSVDVTSTDTSVASGDYYGISTRIEGYDAACLRGGSFTLSFWVSSPKTGTHCVAFRNAGTTSGSTIGADRSYIAEYTVNSANTWEQKSITVTSALPTGGGTWNFTNGIGLEVYFSLLGHGSTLHTTAGSWQTGNYLSTSNQVNVFDSTSNFFYLTGVQLEKGSIATEFEFLHHQEKLALCKRYCHQISSDGVNSVLIGFGLVFDANTVYVQSTTPVPMRVQPSLSFSSAGHLFSFDGTGNPQGSAASLDNLSDGNQIFIIIDFSTSPLTAGRGCYAYVSGGSDQYIRFDAEF